MTTTLDKMAFGAGQAARVSWFFGQKLLAGRLSRPVSVPEALRGRKMPDRKRIVADLRGLLAQDWRNIEAGYYIRPADWPGSVVGELRRAADFFADLGAVERRRHGDGKERLRVEPLRADDGGEDPDDRRTDYPRYYLQTFHHQTDGYLSEASAERYDHQVEVLFGGGAAAMRRQALVPLRQALTGRAIGGKLLDVACGTGQFLREVKTNYPRLAVTGLDLSAPYLAVARRRLAEWSRVSLVEGKAEAMPFPDGEFDVVTCIYLFHELPPRVRRAVVAEVRRVLKPGGALVFVDSLQTGDEPDYDAMLDYFPVALHEPYYSSYLREDLDTLWSPDFTPLERCPAYFSKVVAYRKADSAPS